jgi:hypothetical protein
MSCAFARRQSVIGTFSLPFSDACLTLYCEFCVDCFSWTCCTGSGTRDPASGLHEERAGERDEWFVWIRQGYQVHCAKEPAAHLLAGSWPSIIHSKTHISPVQMVHESWRYTGYVLLGEYMVCTDERVFFFSILLMSSLHAGLLVSFVWK